MFIPFYFKISGGECAGIYYSIDRDPLCGHFSPQTKLYHNTYILLREPHVTTINSIHFWLYSNLYTQPLTFLFQLKVNFAWIVVTDVQFYPYLHQYIKEYIIFLLSLGLLLLDPKNLIFLNRKYPYPRKIDEKL